VRSLLHLAGALALAGLLGGCGAAVLPQITGERDRLVVAEQLLDRGDVLQAIEVLKPYVATGGGAAEIDRGVYLLGRCYLRQKEWGSAEIEFDRLLREYPESDSAASAMFRLAEAYFGQSRGADFDQEYTLKALTQWQSFLRDAPESHWLRLAAAQKVGECRARLATKLEQTGQLYLKLRHWAPARTYFQSVIDVYPDTPPYGSALLGLSIADARLGDKAVAMDRLRELARQFTGQPLGVQATRVLHDIETGRIGPDTVRRSRRSVEGEPVAPAMPPSVGG
jgi:outer membrane protein assembly factor BamD